MRVVIVIKGGVVQYIMSEGEIDVLTLDEDTDGCDEEFLVDVTFSPDEKRKFNVWMGKADVVDLNLVNKIHAQIIANRRRAK